MPLIQTKTVNNFGLKLFQLQKEKRNIWIMTRSFLETDTYKHKRYGRKSKSHWTLFERMTGIFGLFLKATSLYQRGYRNAKNIVVKDVETYFSDLPEPFHGYKILHLTDLHLDCYEGIEDIICKKIVDLTYDLCVLTGDYRTKTKGGFKQILNPMKKLVGAIKAKDGIWATLGNHDTYLMVDFLESIGIKVLANETVTIKRENEKIAVTGIDDPHYYYTDQAAVALEESFKGFKLVLIHTPELYDVAANNGYRLYLCGHTHGGQICLPYGIPLITHVYDGKKYYRGLWRYSNMKGYTNQGCGTVGIPIRFNTQSEIALVTLKRD